MVRGTKIETHLDKLKQARCEQEFIELIQNLLGIKDNLSAEELTQKFAPKVLRKLPDNALLLPKSFSPMWSREKLDSDTYTFDVKWQQVASLEDDSNHYYSLSSNKDMQSVLDFIEAILPNSCSKQSRRIPCTFVLPTEVLDVRSMDGASLSWKHSTISKEDLASFSETRHAWNLLRFLSSIGIEPEGAKGILVALGVLDEHNAVDWFIGHQEKGGATLEPTPVTIDESHCLLGEILRWNELRDESMRFFYLKNALHQQVKEKISHEYLEPMSIAEGKEQDPNVFILSTFNLKPKHLTTQLKSVLAETKGARKSDINIIRECMSHLLSITGGVAITLPLPLTHTEDSRPMLFVPAQWRMVLSAMRKRLAKKGSEHHQPIQHLLNQEKDIKDTVVLMSPSPNERFEW